MNDVVCHYDVMELIEMIEAVSCWWRAEEPISHQY